MQEPTACLWQCDYGNAKLLSLALEDELLISQHCLKASDEFHSVALCYKEDERPVIYHEAGTYTQMCTRFKLGVRREGRSHTLLGLTKCMQLHDLSVSSWMLSQEIDNLERC